MLKTYVGSCHGGAFRSHAIAFLIAFMLPTSAAAGEASQRAPDPDEFQALEDEWNTAHLTGNVEALKQLWSDEIEIVVPGMDSLSKTDALALWSSMPVTFSRYETEIQSMDGNADSVRVSGELFRTRNFGGRKSEDHWLFTKTYRREQGRWRVTEFRATAAE